MNPTEVHSRLADILEEMRALPEVLASAIVRRDGIIIEHRSPPQVDSRKFAAMTAAIAGTGEMATAELGLGGFDQVLVYGAEGVMLATGAGDEALLVTLLRKDANIGLVLLTGSRVVREIEECLRASVPMDRVVAYAVP